MSADAEAVGRTVRRLRRAAGLKQDQLAKQAAVSRQAIGALEAGRHLPRVDAAVAIARALGTTVESLLAPTPAGVVDIHGIKVADGNAVRAAYVGNNTVAMPLLTPQDGEVWAVPDALVQDGHAHPLPGTDLDALVVAGCDPALGMLAALAPRHGPRRLLPIATSSATARTALANNRAHVAIVHDTSIAAPANNVQRIRLASWRTGLAAPTKSAIDDALNGHGLVIQRADGAAAQSAYERTLTDAGLSVPAGPLAGGHRDAARRATDDGIAAVTIEPTALATGLTFHPLETHTVELWIADHAVEHPGLAVLGELLTSTQLRTCLNVLPAYELEVAA